MIALPKAMSRDRTLRAARLGRLRDKSAARAEPDTIASVAANKANFFMTIPITLNQSGCGALWTNGNRLHQNS